MKGTVSKAGSMVNGMAQTPMFRINQLAKDMGLKAKEITAKLEELGIEGKSNMSILDNDEFNIFLDAVTKENKFTDLDAYLSGKLKLTSETDIKGSPENDVKKDKKENDTGKKSKAADKTASSKKAAVKDKEAETDESKASTDIAETADKETKSTSEKIKAENKEASPQAADDTKVPSSDNNNDLNSNLKKDTTQMTASSIKDEKESIKTPVPSNEDVKNTAEAQNKKPHAEAAQYTKKPEKDYKATSKERSNEFQKSDKNFIDSKTRQNQAPYDRKQQENTFNQKKQGTDYKKQAAAQTGTKISASYTSPIQNPSIQTPRQTAINIQNQGMQGARRQKSQGVERIRTGATRVIDTHATSVDLSKYDEKLERFNSDNVISDSQTNRQKLKKQNTRDFRSAKNRDKERLAMEKLKKANAEKAKKQPLKITVPDEITVGDLAARLKVTAASLVKKLMMMGMMVTVNQVIDFDTAYLVADELGAQVTREVVVTIEEKLFSEDTQSDGVLVERAPVVCVMGHVDHGKTSLLDKIRNTRVTAGEAGGITQHIGAYRVSINGRDITFLDTPGHEAFTAMRARGAQATDIAILVVAADDGIMPQTIEAINHAKAAGIDIIVAINKMDKPSANPDQIKSELTNYNLVPEEWGGDTICVPVSALTGEGIEDLLENILLVAEVKELKAVPDRRAKGIVIEARLDKGRGPIATVLVQNGTLKSGDILIAGTAVGHVRAMTNDKGRSIKEAGPSVPVEITGLSEVPQAGDEFNAVEDEKMARTLAEQRKTKAKEDEFKANAKANLDDLFSQIQSGVKELNIIIKADVGGSAEAVKQSLDKISNEEVKVHVIHTAVGGITESDVMLATASNAIIVGFNVRPDKSAIDSAERQEVDIRTYRVIYDCIEEISAAIKGMLAPKFVENVLGHAEVRQTIRVPGVGVIAGSYVQDGKVTRSSSIRIVRDGIVIFEDAISSLKRFKDDAREVLAGFECGIGLEKYNDIHEGDILEAYIMEEVK